MMIYNNKSFLFVGMVTVVALLSTSTAAPENASKRKLRKSKSSTKVRSKLNKKTKPTRVTASPTTKSPSSNPTPLPTSSPTETPKGLRVITNVNVFGDSLSDTGNANQYFPCTATYCPPRSSNGPLVFELFSDALGLGPVVAATKPDDTNNPALPIPNSDLHNVNTNWAFASAAAYTEQTRLFKNDFAFQLELYKAYLEAKQGTTTTTTPSIEATTLQIVSFGGNDVSQALETPTPDDFINSSILALITNIQTLADMGACSFLVSGPPNMSLIPVIGASLPPVQVEAFAFYSGFFSQTLELALKQISISNTDSKCFGVQYFDLFTIMNEIDDAEEFQTEFPDPLAYCNSQFLVPCDQCNAVLDKIPGFPSLPDTGGCFCLVPVTSEDDIQLNCPGIPFFDEYHPNTAMNELFTQRLFADLGVVVDDSDSDSGS